jgi:hypothetical protein
MKGVKIRQVATLASQDDTSHLHVTKIQIMVQRVEKQSNHVWYFAADVESGQASNGHYKSWYEASITSTKADEAFKQNTCLEFGDEAAWTPDYLKDCGALDDLFRAATDTVRLMDGVGYWCSNHQDEIGHKLPPLTTEQRVERIRAREERNGSYW